MATDGFFAVGLDEWRKACSLGLNAACSFLVLACGTGRDNSTTAWSANAVQTYAGISWVRARPAIERLIAAGLASNTSDTKKPRYKLTIGVERIWLPKSIVISANGELPAVHRIRQAQDVLLLRLFVDLYHSQNLAADGGLSRRVYYTKYKKTVYAESGAFIFLGFDCDNSYVSWVTDVTSVHRVEGKSPGDVFFKRIGALRDMGLLEYSVILFEGGGDEAEIIFPIVGPTDTENEMLSVASVIAERLLQPWQIDNSPHKYLVPVLRHQGGAEAFGIYRLRHRPKTALTSAWWASINDLVGQARRLYEGSTKA